MHSINSAFKAMALSLMILPATMLTGCSDVDDGSYVDPIKLSEKVNGNWRVNSVIQTDVANGKELNLTEKLGFSTFNIQLGENGYFTVDGSAPKLIQLNGSWKTDYDYVKSDNSASLLLLNDGTSEQTLTITKTPGATRELELRVTHFNSGEPYVTYTYSLTDANAPTEE
jgi:hypothetical protein